MNIAYPRSLILKCVATVVTLFFLLVVFALPASAKAERITASTAPAKVGKI